jgi:hypothetical protein
VSGYRRVPLPPARMIPFIALVQLQSDANTLDNI